MSRESASVLSRMLREGPLDLGGDLSVQRPLLERLLTAHPLPDGISTASTELGGVPVVEVTATNSRRGDVLLFFHGGGYALGSAAGAAGMVAGVASRAEVRGVSVEYRLAPEQPFPGAVQDALASYRGLLDSGVGPDSVVVAGESAGGGLALALLIAARDAGFPMPAGAFMFSPWVDLTLTGSTMTSKRTVDPALSEEALSIRRDDYLGAADPGHRLASPLHADLTGLPPLLIQCGSAEVLLSDSLRLAARAAESDVQVRLEVTPFAPHVFQGFPDVLEEARAALDSAAAFTRDRLDEAAAFHQRS